VVSDQVRLWQADTQRVRAVPAVLYSGFESPGLWGGTNEKAKQLGAHLWDAAPRAAGA
jgi:Transcription factor Tfb2 (p52) C-terminal domain